MSLGVEDAFACILTTSLANDICITYSDATFTNTIGETGTFDALRKGNVPGINHAADLGVPFAALCVPASGLMALAGGLSVASGYRAPWGAWLLIAFLVPVTVMMHGFWRLHDQQAVHIQQAMFLKNVALVGGALLLAQLGPGL